jgi:hypothetical protein
MFADKAYAVPRNGGMLHNRPFICLWLVYDELQVMSATAMVASKVIKKWITF